MTNRRVARGLQLASLLALYALFAIGYSLLVPLWEAPDETTHYLVVEHVARHGEMPPFEVSYEAMQPPGYYWLAGALLRFLEGVDPQLTARTRPPLTPQSSYTRYDWTAQNYRFMWGLQMLRWFNAALGAIALFFIHQGSRELLAVKENGSASTSIGPSPLAVAALVALTPQFLHNATSVSNDALANACGALLFWLLVQSALRPPGARRLALAALTATVLPFLIKLTILPTSAALLLVLAWRAWRARRRLFVTTVATSSAALAAGMVLVAPASALLSAGLMLIHGISDWWKLPWLAPIGGWSLLLLAYWRMRTGSVVAQCASCRPLARRLAGSSAGLCNRRSQRPDHAAVSSALFVSGARATRHDRRRRLLVGFAAPERGAPDA